MITRLGPSGERRADSDRQATDRSPAPGCESGRDRPKSSGVHRFCTLPLIMPSFVPPLIGVDALKKAADAYLDTCFSRETPPHAGELAALFGIEPHKLTRLFQTLLNRTPSAYLKECQISHAKEMLRTGSLPMNAIAYGSGFGTRVSFYRAFRRVTGITPATYRARHVHK